MTKHYTEFEIDFHDFDFENDPDSAANLHLWLPAETFSRMESAMNAMSIRTREDFAVLAILWALQGIQSAASRNDQTTT